VLYQFLNHHKGHLYHQNSSVVKCPKITPHQTTKALFKHCCK
jgi:hypothetical protein